MSGTALARAVVDGEAIAGLCRRTGSPPSRSTDAALSEATLSALLTEGGAGSPRHAPPITALASCCSTTRLRTPLYGPWRAFACRRRRQISSSSTGNNSARSFCLTSSGVSTDDVSRLPAPTCGSLMPSPSVDCHPNTHSREVRNETLALMACPSSLSCCESPRPSVRLRPSS